MKIGDKVIVFNENYIGEIVLIGKYDKDNTQLVYTIKPLMKNNKFIKNGSERGYIGNPNNFFLPLTEEFFDKQSEKLKIEVQIIERNKRVFFK